MSIFDNMTDEPATPPSVEGGYFKLQFGLGDIEVPIREGQTLSQAFQEQSEFLGFESDRNLAYRDNENNVLDGTEAPQPGGLYTASLMHDEKG